MLAAVAVRIGFLLLGAFAAVRADTIELKTGEKIEGKFKQATDAGAVIEVGGQPVAFPLEKVKGIYFGTPPQSSSQNNTMAEAIDALRGLRSLSRGGVTLRDYTSRTADARVRVGRFLDSDGDAAKKSRVDAAMRTYELAIPLWNSDMLKAMDVFKEIGSNEIIKRCAAITSAGEEVDRGAFQKTGKHPPEDMRITGIAFSANARPQLLWECAEQIIAKIEP